MHKIKHFLIRNATEMHVGSGSGKEMIDNAIMRHKDEFPYLPSSAIKGTLRIYLEESNVEQVNVFFGKSDRASAVGILDAEIVFFPTTSAKGLHCWVTCPFALGRLLERLNLSVSDNSLLDTLLNQVKMLPETKAFVSSKALVFGQIPQKSLSENKPSGTKQQIMIAETCLDAETIKSDIFVKLSLALWQNQYSQETFSQKIVIVNDDFFREVVTRKVNITANIKIEPNGVTKATSLRYTEYLPENTIFHSAFVFQQVNEKASDDFIQKFIQKLPKKWQIGAQFTLGKGLFHLKVVGDDLWKKNPESSH